MSPSFPHVQLRSKQIDTIPAAGSSSEPFVSSGVTSVLTTQPPPYIHGYTLRFVTGGDDAVMKVMK